MKKIVKVLLLTLSLLFLFACHQGNQEESKGLDIVTSFYPVYSITQYVSGDLNEVSMIQSSAGIHSFEPSSKDIADIESSDLFIYHSSQLESWAKNLKENLKNSETDLLEATEGIELLKVPGLEDLEISPDSNIDDKALYDPHSWMDPDYAAQEAQVIADALSQRDSDHAKIYQENADRFQAEAQAILDEYVPKFKDKKQREFVTQHTAFYYLAERLGLKQLGIAGISDESEPSPKQMAKIQDYVEEKNIKTIFVEQNAKSHYAETVAQATGADIDLLDPLESDPDNGKSFLENVEENIKRLDKALE